MCGIYFHNLLAISWLTVLSIALVVWVHVYLGDGLHKIFSSSRTPQDVFLWHPVIMFFAYGGMMSYGMIAYRLFPGNHETRKIMHMCFHCSACLLGYLGLYPVYYFHSHNMKNGVPAPIPDNYSVHSYFGLMTVSVSSLQWLLGFVYYFLKLPGLVPTESLRRRMEFAPLHKFLGMTTYVCAAVTLILGIFDKQHIFNLTAANGKMYSGLSIYANVLAIACAWLTAIILYYYTTPYRKPQPMFDHDATYTEEFLPQNDPDA